MYRLPDGAVRISTSAHFFALSAYAMSVVFGIHYSINDFRAASMYEWMGPLVTTLWAMTITVSSIAALYGAAVSPSSQDPLPRRRLELFGCAGLALMYGFYELSLVRENGFYTFPATEMLALGFALGGLLRGAQITAELLRVRPQKETLLRRATSEEDIETREE